MHVLRKGHVLVWDELENSLHPHVAELVLSLFNDPEIQEATRNSYSPPTILF
ncbi:hypothetical protein OURE66S_04480 [Oligella ureolytica]